MQAAHEHLILRVLLEEAASREAMTGKWESTWSTIQSDAEMGKEPVARKLLEEEEVAEQEQEQEQEHQHLCAGNARRGVVAWRGSPAGAAAPRSSSQAAAAAPQPSSQHLYL